MNSASSIDIAAIRRRWEEAHQEQVFRCLPDLNPVESNILFEQLAVLMSIVVLIDASLRTNVVNPLSRPFRIKFNQTHLPSSSLSCDFT